MTQPRPNGLGVALGLLGDEWSLLVVRSVLLGTRRFGALQRQLGIGPSVLSARLGALVDGGVLVRSADGGYALTRSGRELWRLLLCLWAWEQRWAAHDEPLPVMRHRRCGQRLVPELACGCGQAVARGDLAVSWGPHASMARSVPTGSRRRRTGGRQAAGPGLFPETMSLIGSRWSAAVLGAALLGAERFAGFRAVLGAPPAVLAERLRTFVALDVLDPSYRLTPKGEAFLPAVVQLVTWGERWHAAPDGPALVAGHAGHPFVPRLRCAACREELQAREVAIEGVELAAGVSA